MKKIKLQDMLFVVVSLILATFFCVHAEREFDRPGYEASTENVEEVIRLENGGVLLQELTDALDDDNRSVSALGIMFGTYRRENEGTVTVGLYEDDRVVQTWEYDASDMEDNTYVDFYLDSALTVRKGHQYSFSVAETYEGDNGVAVWRNDQGQICYRLIGPDAGLQRTVMVIAGILWLAVVALVLLRVDERVTMTIFLAALSAVYFWLCPLNMVPDECNHFYRAYEISCGSLISQHMGESGTGGNVLPSALQHFGDPDATIDWAETEEYIYENTALYSPFSYIPQSLGIRIAKGYTDSPQSIFYGGRLAGWLCSLALYIAALWLIPFGRKLLFMVMCFPMTMQEMISLAPDGFVTGLCLFLLAYVLHLSYDRERIGGKDLAILTILCLELSQCKIVYVVLLLLLWLIPNDHFGSTRRMAALKLGVPVIAVLCNLMWLAISAGFLVEFTPGVDSVAQVRYVLSHMIVYYRTAVRTTIDYGPNFLRQMFGQSLGWLSISISYFAWEGLLILFVYEIATCRDVPVHTHRWDVPIMLLVFLSCSALIYTSLYVQWTAYQNERIEGIQGRYFLPIIVLPALCAAYGTRDREVQAGNRNVYAAPGRYQYLVLLLMNGITILDVIAYYIEDFLAR